MRKLKEGDRVKVVSLGIKGTITYVEWNTLDLEHMNPIQLELDKTYDGSGHKTYRTSLKDLRRLRRKKR